MTEMSEGSGAEGRYVEDVIQSQRTDTVNDVIVGGWVDSGGSVGWMGSVPFSRTQVPLN